MKLVSVIAVLLVLGAGYYAVSDPFQAKVDKMVEDQTEWTSENIQKDPEGYVRWALKELAETKTRLEARRLDMRKKQSMAEQEGALSGGLVQQLNEKMAKLKDAYRAASKTGTWPVEVDGISISEENLKKMVVDADRRITAANRKVELADLIKLKTSTQLKLIEDKLVELGTQETELDMKLSEVKMSKALDSLTAIKDNVREIVTTAESIDTDSSKEITLDDLMAPESKSAALTNKFDEIMKK